MENLADVLNAGFGHHKAGNLSLAEQHYRRVLQADPRNASALHLLGMLARQVGKHDVAIQLVGAAIRLDGGQAGFHSTLAEAYRGLGQVEQAIACYRQALRLSHDFVEGHSNLGTLLHGKGDYAGAGACYAEALRLRPDYLDAHYNLGIIRQIEQNWPEAERHYRRVLAMKSNHAGALVGLGQILREQEREEESARCFELAVQSDEDSQTAQCGLGMALQGQGKLDEAIAHYRRAIQIAPDVADAYYNLGAALRAKEMLPESVGYFQEALRRLPTFFEALLALANVSNLLGRPDDAVGPSRRALELNPNAWLAWSHLASALHSQGDMQGGMTALRRSIELNPEYAEGNSNLVYAMNFHDELTPEEVFGEHLNWARRHAEPLTARAAPHTNSRDPERRIRVGYVSSHFREHAVSFFSEPMIAAHNHDEFEIFCYADVPKPDAFTQRFRQAADVWRDVAGRDDEEIADAVRRDQIDILVDLAGHIGGNHLLAFARKPAPIQVTYLGYQNTTGMSAMDYRLSDEHADPPGVTERFYTEQLVRLPRAYFCYAPPDPSPEVNALPALSKGYVTFGSFNHLQKITRRAIETWAQILAAAPNSRFLMLAYSAGQFERDFRDVMARAGIEPGRVQVVDKRVRYEYMRFYHEVDLALDSFPFNGHTTVCDALWMGVPSIMLEGKTYASRFGGSVLLNLDLGNLIARSREEYIARAVETAGNLDWLAGLRAASRARMESSALLDAKGFTRNLEQAYREMWRAWRRKPASDLSTQQTVQ